MVKILVIDDDPTYCRNVKWFLVDQGHKVRTFTDPEKGVRALQRFAPDVTIVDWRLHDQLEQHRFLDQLRRQNPQVKVVLTTTATHAEGEKKKTRYDRVLVKPFRMADLLELL